MGLFWDLLQQSQISDQKSTARSLEQRVAALEANLYETQRLQRHLLEILERHFNADLDGDGKIG